jgi:hypothetical protein
MTTRSVKKSYNPEIIIGPQGSRGLIHMAKWGLKSAREKNSMTTMTPENKNLPCFLPLISFLLSPLLSVAHLRASPLWLSHLLWVDSQFRGQKHSTRSAIGPSWKFFGKEIGISTFGRNCLLMGPGSRSQGKT